MRQAMELAIRPKQVLRRSVLTATPEGSLHKALEFSQI
jgi:hypothetical protein